MPKQGTTADTDTPSCDDGPLESLLSDQATPQPTQLLSPPATGPTTPVSVPDTRTPVNANAGSGTAAPSYDEATDAGSRAHGQAVIIRPVLLPPKTERERAEIELFRTRTREIGFDRLTKRMEERKQVEKAKRREDRAMKKLGKLKAKMARKLEKAESKSKRREQRAVKKLKKLKTEMTKKLKDSELKAAMMTKKFEVERTKAAAWVMELETNKPDAESKAAARVKELEAENKALREDTVRRRALQVAASALQHAGPAIGNVQAIAAVPGLMQRWQTDRLWRWS